MPTLQEQSLQSLLYRQQLAREVVRKLRTDWRDDPRAADAEVHYAGQLRTITEEIRRRRREARQARGEEKPPAVINVMNVARMGAAVPKRTEDILAQARQILALQQEDANG